MSDNGNKRKRGAYGKKKQQTKTMKILKRHLQNKKRREYTSIDRVESEYSHCRNNLNEHGLIQVSVQQLLNN
jgi:hypothetical protein